MLALGKPADIYLLDEPSSYLDSEQRIIVSRSIKKFIMNTNRTAFIVEHDFTMSTYLADKVIVFTGTPSVSEPMSLQNGMNIFLKNLGVTFRRDKKTHRPRINKKNSLMETEQIASGNYFD